MSTPATNTSSPTTSFSTANPHALATILDASQTQTIIASRDIFDISGIKLWARDQPVSSALQRKLLDRQLRNPLETCLMAEGGVTPVSLAESLETLIARDTPLAAMLRPHGPKLLQEVAHLPLHSVAQLLLSAGQAARPEAYDHAIQAMALCGALMIGQGGTLAELRLAMLAGLLHDLGELYIDPQHGEADADRTLDFISYQQLVVHPHVGNLLLAQLTNYPAPLARAVAEHHERMDGSGYPHALTRDAMSPLGRLLAVAEAALSVLRHGHADLSRASVALRVVPGEFDLTWVSPIAKAAQSQPPLCASLDTASVQRRLSRLAGSLHTCEERATALTHSAETAELKAALSLSQYLLGRLRTGWYASGLWSTELISPQDAGEVESVEDELFFRLRSIERAALLRAGDLPPSDTRRLKMLCEGLRAVGR
jgi:HD domain